jgi:DNA-directed RNA polymerase I subunit RPA49
VPASTPGLTLPSSISLEPYTLQRGKATSRSGNGSGIATKELLLHSSEHPRIDYTAREEEAGGSDKLLKHYVGVYDPETSKMEVMEARKVVVRGVVRAHEATEEDNATAVSINSIISTISVLILSLQTMRERRNDLGQTFGTKKAKKAIASVTENAIDQSKLFRDPSKAAQPEKLTAANMALLGSLAESAANMPTREELGDASTSANTRPEGNKEAMDPTKIYTVEKVIGLDTMKIIPVRQWMETMKAKKEITTSSRFVARRLQMHAQTPEKLKILRYMLLLIDFYNASSGGKFGRRLPKRDDLKKILGDMPEAALEGVKRKFTNAGIMNKQMSDSLIMHLCAMAFMVDGADVDTWDLKEDLKLETKQITIYFTQIGAKIASLGEVERKKLGLEKAAAAQRRVAKLKAPLTYPKVSVGRRMR